MLIGCPKGAEFTPKIPENSKNSKKKEILPETQLQLRDHVIIH